MIKYMPNWLKRLIRSAAKKNVFPLSGENDGLDKIINACSVNIAGALENLAEMNPIAACSNHKDTANLVAATKRMYRQTLSNDNESVIIYVDYMLEATEKIAETIRYIVTKPEAEISIAAKCELLTVREIFIKQSKRLRCNATEETESSDLLSEISNDSSFVKHLIDEHSKTMNHADFEDGAIAYSYLMLLYYIHSYIDLLKKVIKVTSILRHPYHCRAKA